MNAKNLERLVFEENDIARSNTFLAEKGQAFELEAVKEFVTDKEKANSPVMLGGE